MQHMGVPAQIGTTPKVKNITNTLVLAMLLQKKLEVDNSWIARGGENPIDRPRFAQYKKKFTDGFTLSALKDFYPKLLKPRSQRSHLDNLKLNQYEYLLVSNFLLKEIFEAAGAKIELPLASGANPSLGSYARIEDFLHGILAEKYLPFDFVNGYRNGYMRGLLDKGALKEMCLQEGKENVLELLDAALNEWHEGSRVLQTMGKEIDGGDQAANLFSHASMCVYNLLKAVKEEVDAL